MLEDRNNMLKYLLKFKIDFSSLDMKTQDIIINEFCERILKIEKRLEKLENE